MDTINISELLLTLSISNDKEGHSQATLLSLTIAHDISRTARSDDLTYSINYAAVYATLVETLPKIHYTSLDVLVDHVFETLFRSHPDIHEACVIATLRDTLPRFTIEMTRRRDQTLTDACKFALIGLGFSAIIGVNPRERIEKQTVLFDITVQRTGLQEQFPFFGLTTSIRETFAPSEYLTVEALASAVACHVLKYTKDPNDRVAIKLSKPNALPLAGSAQVQITRKQDDFPHTFSPRAFHDRLLPLRTSTHLATETANNGSSPSLHSVAIALGSNLGDRFANIETALRLLEVPTSLLSDLAKDAQISVVDTSFMYETAPMYVTDQPRFANCACMIETNLSPNDMLCLVKAIETAVGRIPSVRHGPRAVDLDILTYDDQLVDTRPPDSRARLDNLIGELVIPHPRISEREFVLRPLNDMIPHFVHPACNKNISTLLQELMSTRREDDLPMLKVIPFPKYPLNDTEVVKIDGVQVPRTAKHWTVSPTDSTKYSHPRKTRLMATLNVTPDSFSDGAEYNTLPAAIVYTATAVTSGADIIDIGGYSTRPGADFVSTEEEIRRVVPVIQTIRAHGDDAVRHALISVDTFRWDVAEQAVRAGANCINDVHAFTGPTYPLDATSAKHLARMRGVARGLSVPVVLMHSRGDAGANKDYNTYHGDLVPAIQAELGHKVDAIVRGPGGVRRWLVLVDPGIGFSKPVEGQLALMRNLNRVTADQPGNVLAGYPLLFGASKKSVLGAVLEEPDMEGTYQGRKTNAQERGWATAAAVACAVQQGASVVRVHDVAEMRDVVAVASAIWSR
ncbi:Dihydropteroate synthase-like protein [Lanmaoa asiatica]|nr:Dihydropteroate synthase-like protein [Lanmaoa asiatica]